jgi:hypothetical protein
MTPFVTVLGALRVSGRCQPQNYHLRVKIMKPILGEPDQKIR